MGQSLEQCLLEQLFHFLKYLNLLKINAGGNLRLYSIAFSWHDVEYFINQKCCLP